MKKISVLLVIAVISLCFTDSISAQRIRFGIKGGVNFSDANLKDVVEAGDSKTYTGFNAGIVLNVKLILGFSIQPELIYTQTGMKFMDNKSGIDVSSSITHGAIELPINIQWGIKLGPVRPYVQASPYIGYSVLNRMDIGGSINDILDPNKFQYGMGLGFGVDIWKFQVSYRYKWDINSLSRTDIVNGYNGLGASKLRSSEISLGFFF